MGVSGQEIMENKSVYINKWCYRW